ncbi:MAG: hypothetical protein K9K67_01165 [Bacteriovoracaceae bacterium]|nr:hypothetical protein [Bacteriovoracaceae bacterium]
MKSLVFIISFLTLSTHAQTLNCQWLESSEHAAGFYRPAKIQMTFKDQTVTFVEDTFLFRTYSPCWVGNFSSCAFGFNYEGNTWTITSNVNKTYELEAPGFYWDAQLTFEFEKELKNLSRGEVVKASLSGDDGDGVMFSDEAFLCQKI